MLQVQALRHEKRWLKGAPAAGKAASPAEDREAVLLGERLLEAGGVWGVVVAVGGLAGSSLGGCTSCTL